MAECIPDRNWQIVQKALEDNRVPKDTFLAEVCEAYKDRTKDEELSELIQYIEEDYYRDVLVAFFLSGMPRNDIAKFLRMEDDLLSKFELLVVNPFEFRNKLDIFWYAEKYADACVDERGRQIVQAGIQLGPYGLMAQYTHGNEDIPIDTKQITKKMLQVAYTLSQVARGNPITSMQTKEAFKWMNGASKMAKESERIGADTTEEDEALMAVKERVMARSAVDAGIPPGEIMH